MTAWVVGRIQVLDAAAWSEYRAGVPATLPEYGGELVCRGTHREGLGPDGPAGGDPFGDGFVVLRFPDREAARAWYDSDAYQALIPLRRRAARVELTVYESD